MLTASGVCPGSRVEGPDSGPSGGVGAHLHIRHVVLLFLTPWKEAHDECTFDEYPAHLKTAFENASRFRALDDLGQGGTTA